MATQDRGQAFRVNEVYESLNKVMTLAGIPVDLFILNAYVSVVVWALLDTIGGGLFLFIVTTSACFAATRDDPKAVNLFFAAQRFKRCYDPVKPATRRVRLISDDPSR